MEPSSEAKRRRAPTLQQQRATSDESVVPPSLLNLFVQPQSVTDIPVQPADASIPEKIVHDSSQNTRRSNLHLYHSNQDLNQHLTANYLTSQSWDPQSCHTSISILSASQSLPPTNAPSLSNLNLLQPAPKANISAARKLLGTVEGVFLPCLQNILGIIMFVRLPWITGVAGVGYMLLIWALSIICTLLTTMSMAAIATNGHVPAGGAYYMISRSLGKEWGVSVGVVFYLSTAVGTAVYVLGSVEILIKNMIPQASLGDSAMNGRVYGTAILILLSIIASFGMRHLTRFATVFLFSVVTAIVSIFIGLLASNRDGMPLNEVVGFPGVLSENWPPGYQELDLNGDKPSSTITFFLLFSIFFPSVTGIMAGSNRSGDLRNPSKSIPTGTLGAWLASSIIYLTLILLFGTVCTGPFLRTAQPPNGLHVGVVAWPTKWVALVGCLLSSIGAALQCLAGAPRLLQALAKDDIIPVLGVFKKTWNSEPRRALFFTYIIAQAAVAIGTLDAVAPIATMLYLICYAFVNFSTALLSLLNYPNWRPSWRWYHWSSSLLGTILCVVFMFLMNWIIALISLTVVLALTKYVEWRGAQVEWGDGMFALNLSVAQKNLLVLERRRQVHAKNWRPQIMAFVDIDRNSQLPADPSILSFLGQLRKAGGLSMITTCVDGSLLDRNSAKDVDEYRELLSYMMKEHGVPGFSQVIVSQSPHDAKLTALQSCGVGFLRPNTILLSYPSKWRTTFDEKSCDHFFSLLRSIIAADKTVILLKADNPSFPFPTHQSAVMSSQSTIDVYWIMHDGGILTLLPYLLKKHRIWKKCLLRVFCVAQADDNSIQILKDLRTLLQKFRIDAEARVVELGDYDISEFTYEKTMKMRERSELLSEMKINSEAELLVTAPSASLHTNPTNVNNTSHSWKRRNLLRKEKAEFMNTSVKLNHVILQNSRQACLVFCNLPAPNKRQASVDYLEYLDALTADLPRVVLVKGTGTEVVTAYF